MKKEGLTTSQLIMSIGGILILLLLIILPPTFRILDDKVETNSDNKVDESIKENEQTNNVKLLYCNSLENPGNSYVVYYEDDKIVKYDMNIFTTYTDVSENSSEYETAIKKCSNTSNDYNGINGYSRGCIQDGGTLTETIVYDLKTFVGKTITLSDGTTSDITSEFKYGDNIEEVKTKITNNQYMCN